jgi:hypothetical protein
MKLTETRLRQIIKEEVVRAVRESSGRGKWAAVGDPNVSTAELAAMGWPDYGDDEEGSPWGDDDEEAAAMGGKSPPYDPEEWRALLLQGRR